MLGQPAPQYRNSSESEDWERFLKESNNQSFNDLFSLCKQRELSGPKEVTDNTHDSYRNSGNDSGAGCPNIIFSLILFKLFSILPLLVINNFSWLSSSNKSTERL